ncbi:MAG: DUF2523 domain-containing protein [Methylobacter sp.]|nr:DUF2523 domain-containing protein [Methylobacter sp.]MDP2097026.1 DUF2523 domain-containing protein [Methylobacter sp.]MDP2428074.1 DUF2523 domain-containing protein [Methylobacter sp.]MDP3055075.1 DUF2523 domain-containing protein [Methylobacter sp.]MDP3361436.1 DUF2523 domain-containing protein [Methylobacter sp.]
MPTLAAFLLSIAGTLTGRVLLALGIGWVSYSGLNVLVSQIVDLVKVNYQSLSGVVLQILNLAGAGDAMGILIAALVTRTALVAIKKLAAIQ